jgi:hypothetical protein
VYFALSVVVEKHDSISLAGRAPALYVCLDDCLVNLTFVAVSLASDYRADSVGVSSRSYQHCLPCKLTPEQFETC